MRIVLASNNAKKLVELQALLSPLGLQMVTQASLGIDEAEEPFGTFVENALAKARHAAAACGGAAIADDSGLCVDALGGAPGVVSARYAGLFGDESYRADASSGVREVVDAANNRLLLERLSQASDRSASFVCALVALRTADDPEPLIAFGRWSGEIVVQPSGAGGFGYDPLLFIPSLSSTVGDLAPEVKNRHSHRAIATRQMADSMRSVWRLG
ncbi:MAG: non-canonical purine pyrophosphatase [Rhizobacter sp.]|nr:non-canonical purine pyrophosphatase [Rhizobacter sp.]